MNQSSQQAPDNFGKDDIDLASYLDLVIGSRRLIGAIIVVFVIVGALYAFLATPIYRADMMIQVEDNSDPSGTGNLVSSVSSLFQVKSVTAGEIEILRSRMVVSRAVDKLRLYINASPRYFPFVGGWIARHNDALSKPGIFGLNGYAWGNESIGLGVFDVPKEMIDRPFVLRMLTTNRYRLTNSHFDLSVEGQVGQHEVFKTNQGDISLFVESVHANPGIEFNLVRHSRLAIIASIQAGMNILEKGKQQSGVIGTTLDGPDPVMITRILNQVGSEYVQQNIDLKSAEAAKSLTFLDVELPKMKKALDEAEQSYTTLRKQHGTVDVGAEGKLALQQSADAQSQLFVLQQKREDLAARFTASHPSVRALDEQIAATRQQIAGFDARIKALPTVEQGVVRGQLDVQVNHDLYLALLQSSQQLSLIKAGKVGNVRVVDQAVVPEAPVKPVIPLILAISALAGLLVGVGTAFTRNLLFGGVTDPHEIEQHTGLNVYATIPYSNEQRELAKNIRAKLPQLSVLAQLHPHDPTIESLRSFRTALQFAMLGSQNNIVMLSGASPGLGKSFISANFAAVVASAGKRVLLIDGDLRKGYLNLYFGLNRNSGLSEMISGSISIDAGIRKTGIENLDLISTGTMPPNPGELLLAPQLGRLLNELSGRYDIVILDTPPVLAAADAAIMAPLVGAAFFIAMAGVTKTGELVESARRLAQTGVQVKGVLFNGMTSSNNRYGYGSKYGSYRYVAYQYGPGKD